MRSVPLGVLKNTEDVINAAKINASLTHDTPKGIASSVGVALLSHYNFYDGGIKDFESQILLPLKEIDQETFEYLKNVDKMNGLDSKLLFGEKYQNRGVPCDGMRTFGAVHYILSNYSKAENILLESVKLGGDTDSTASIALGIYAINNGLKSLPDFLYNDLTNDKYGRDYILDLGNKLEKKFK